MPSNSFNQHISKNNLGTYFPKANRNPFLIKLGNIKPVTEIFQNHITSIKG